MHFFDGLCMAFGTYSALPVPRRWTERGAVWLLPLLPLVGVVVGLVWWGAGALMETWGAPDPLQGAVLALVPLVLTGGLHLDGFADVSDAVLSRRALQQRREILKDPHIGTFGALALGGYLLLSFAALMALADGGGDLVFLPLAGVVVRCVAALVLLYGRPMSQTGYGALYRTHKRRWHGPWLVLAGLCGVAAAVWLGALGPTLAAGAGACLCALWSGRSLEGVNGDVAGHAITGGELCALLWACWMEGGVSWS